MHDRDKQCDLIHPSSSIVVILTNLSDTDLGKEIFTS